MRIASIIYHINLFLFTLIVLLLAGAAFGEDSPTIISDTAIKQAKDLLSLSLPVANVTDTLRLKEAIADLDKILVPVAAKPLPPLTHQMLAKLIHGRFTLRGDVVTIQYDFSDGKQASDWTLAGDEPTLDNGTLNIPAGSSMTCKVEFTADQTFSGELAMLNRNGDHIGTSGGASVHVSNYNAWNVDFSVAGVSFGSQKFSPAYTETDGKGQWIPWIIANKNGVTSLAWTDQKLAKPSTTNLGTLTLKGGMGGDQYRNVTVSGTIDRAWVASALEELAHK